MIGDDSAASQDYSLLGYTYPGHNEYPHEVVYQHNTTRLGLGGNLNSLLYYAASAGIDIVLQQDDDHWLVKELDITRHVEKLFNDPMAGAIRLMGIAGHGYTAELFGNYWRLNWLANELYIASNRPHLKSIRKFHGLFGYYPEGLKLGHTEESFCHLCKDKAHELISSGQLPLSVLVPLDVQTESGWQHSEQHGGVSWQARGF